MYQFIMLILIFQCKQSQLVVVCHVNKSAFVEMVYYKCDASFILDSVSLLNCLLMTHSNRAERIPNMLDLLFKEPIEKPCLVFAKYALFL